MARLMGLLYVSIFQKVVIFCTSRGGWHENRQLDQFCKLLCVLAVSVEFKTIVGSILLHQTVELHVMVILKCGCWLHRCRLICASVL